MSQFQVFAERVVAEQDANLLNDGPEVQTAAVVAALERFHARRPIRPHVEEINAFGFGTAFTCFVTGAATPAETYLRLFPLAEAIGIGIPNAARLGDDKLGWAIRDQRRADEESGVLGWDYLNDWVSLDLDLILDDPTAKPDAGGRRWTGGSDWLVSLTQLTELVMLSPWGKEFMDNAIPMFSYGFKHSGLDKLAGSVETYVAQVDDDGIESAVKTGRTLADTLAADRAGISEDEARKRAFRGPHLGGAS